MLSRGPLLLLALALVFASIVFTSNRALLSQDLPAILPIKRALPPPGIEVPEEVKKELAAKLAELAPRINKLRTSLPQGDEAYRADIEVFTKAVSYALRFDEFYDKKDFDKARWALKQAEERLNSAEKGEFPWTKQTGLVVRGYRSSIDGSVQPYGLVIPENHDFDKPCPLYVFLHGRGDKETDLHFNYGRARNKGEIVPDNAIVVHPFGRQCIGFKSAGEIDVLETVGNVQRQYKVASRPALVGFSMGGAGAWHIGAHYPDHWSVVAPGAGFVDVKRYQNLKPEKFPPLYEQQLWGAYDVPAYTRNLFNLPVIAYSGELDKQKDAADFMGESFAKEGRELTHLIGPQTEHKYHPEVKKQLLEKLAAVSDEPDVRAIAPEAHLQTRTLRYCQAGWLTAMSLEAHWQDARLDGHYKDGRFEITTKNVARFQVTKPRHSEKLTFVVDGKEVDAGKSEQDSHAYFERRNGEWVPSTPFIVYNELRIGGKMPHLQGPIDDAFLNPFLVVLPSGKATHPRVQQWIDFEVAHLRERWAATFRGELPCKLDTEVTPKDIQTHNLICFGDADSNAIVKRALPKLPLQWNDQTLTLADRKLDAATHVPLMIYPNPLDPLRYIVLNSGPTFREAHDRTNSLQNPKLPDWAIIDITTPPDGEKPGKVVAADFFDEEWKVKTKK